MSIVQGPGPTGRLDDGDRDGRPVDEGAGPPRIGVLTALGRHPVLAALPAVVLVALAVLLGVLREPNYEAQARLAVGGFDFNQPGAITGAAGASASLASAYSRTVESEIILDRVAQRLNVDPGSLRTNVAATPIPESPVFQISATATNEQLAVRAANATTDVLREYVRRTSDVQRSVDALFRQFRRASLLYNERISERQVAQRAYDRSNSPRDLRRLEKTRAAADTAQLRTQSLRQAYQLRLQSASTRQGEIQVLTRPTSAASDRVSFLSRLVFAALVAGVALGLALAVLRANRSLRDRLLRNAAARR